MRDLLKAAQGIGGYYVRRGPNGLFQIDSRVAVGDPIFSMVLRIGHLGTLYQILWDMVHGEPPASLALQAFRDGLREHLLEHLRTLGTVEEAIDQDNSVSLRHVVAWLTPALERMEVLVSLANACEGLKGGALLSAISAFAQHGSPKAAESIQQTLHYVMGPLREMMDLWMAEGILQDPYDEFFVYQRPSTVERLWHERYILDEAMVPSFIHADLAQRIVRTGKSLNFIRECCEDDFISTKETVQWATMAELKRAVEVRASWGNEHLVQLLLGKYRLMEHAKALRRYLLLGQGDFAGSLLDLSASALDEPAKMLHAHTMREILDMAVRQSNGHDPETVKCLDVHLHVANEQEIGWDIFTLAYTIPAPLHVVFSPQAMEGYQRAFAVLWKLRRVSHALALCWNQQMTFSRGPSPSGLPGAALRDCQSLRAEMNHFVSTLNSYVTLQCLETPWSSFCDGVASAKDLDEVIHFHQEYLNSIQARSFSVPDAAPVLQGVLALLKTILSFTAVHDQLYTSTFASEGREQQAIARSSQELRVLRASFHRDLRALFTRVYAEGDSRDLSRHLNFNAFYRDLWLDAQLRND
jgi:gamma-tubulin complex component 3